VREGKSVREAAEKEIHMYLAFGEMSVAVLVGKMRKTAAISNKRMCCLGER
jgi:hypothetical protein